MTCCRVCLDIRDEGSRPITRTPRPLLPRKVGISVTYRYPRFYAIVGNRDAVCPATLGPTSWRPGLFWRDNGPIQDCEHRRYEPGPRPRARPGFKISLPSGLEHQDRQTQCGEKPWYSDAPHNNNHTPQGFSRIMAAAKAFGSVTDIENAMWAYRVRLNGADHQWGKDPPKEVVG